MLYVPVNVQHELIILFLLFFVLNVYPFWLNKNELIF